MFHCILIPLCYASTFLCCCTFFRLHSFIPHLHCSSAVLYFIYAQSSFLLHLLSCSFLSPHCSLLCICSFLLFGKKLQGEEWGRGEVQFLCILCPWSRCHLLRAGSPAQYPGFVFLPCWSFWDAFVGALCIFFKSLNSAETTGVLGRAPLRPSCLGCFIPSGD